MCAAARHKKVFFLPLVCKEPQRKIIFLRCVTSAPNIVPIIIVRVTLVTMRTRTRRIIGHSLPIQTVMEIISQPVRTSIEIISLPIQTVMEIISLPIQTSIEIISDIVSGARPQLGSRKARFTQGIVAPCASPSVTRNASRVWDLQVQPVHPDP